MPARAKRRLSTTRVRSRAMPATPPDSIVTRSAAFIEPDERQALIADGAYFRAERRGFDPGHEIDDWLEAESEIDEMLSRNRRATPCG